MILSKIKDNVYSFETDSGKADLVSGKVVANLQWSGEKIARFYGDSDMKVLNYGLKKEFIDRYDVKEILLENHLTAEQIADDVMQVEQKR